MLSAHRSPATAPSPEFFNLMKRESAVGKSAGRGSPTSRLKTTCVESLQDSVTDYRPSIF
jgi:hypothetical protein